MASLSMIISVILASFQLAAQAPGGRLPPDDPALYKLFFYFHDGITSEIQRRSAQNTLSAAREEKGFAAKLRINQDELPKITAVAHQFVTDATQWQENVKAYVDRIRAQGKQPDHAVLRQFDEQERQLLDAALRRLSITLSPASWAGLRHYINDEHRLHIRAVPVKQTK